MKRSQKGRPRRLSLVLVGLALTTPTALAVCNIVDGKPYGDCQGVVVQQGAKPLLHVRSYVSESGIVDGARVYRGGTLHFNGISNGNFVVERGGKLFIAGTVNGSVFNDGGIVEVDGIVNHLVSNGGSVTVGGIVSSFTGSGPAMFKKGSVLAGAPLERKTRLP